MARPAAFFDLDRTLIDVNSGVLYAKHEYRAGRIGFFKLTQSMFYMFLYHLSLVDMQKAYASAVRHYEGVPAAELDERTRSWFAAEVDGRLQPGARAALEEHARQGHPRVLLTSSSSYVSRCCEESWGLDGWIANSFPTDGEGRLDGTYEPPLCYGPGKVLRAETWAEEHDVDLDASHFYSDSYTDLPMLERVGHPHVVNPDPRLRREAKRRAWPVLDWSRAPVERT